ncbi:CBS domain-containing protein [Prauserella flavalba]|uniref:CBS domain-containing protein n=1 Tax=Prauserella flavalba TaxID=1477506 RepID=A0A318LW46_9PSEU|nr:CBS domain-containing protein [Prauserella flavalba]PXY36697.1 hypothetical protein BA062_15175 [Prauserella flavalba]
MDSTAGVEVRTPDQRTVRSVMTPRPYTVGPGTELADIAALLTEQGISGVPVVDDRDAVLGVVTEADLISARLHPHAGHGRGLRLRRRQPADHHSAAAPKARELMSAPVLSVDADTSLAAAARMLGRSGVRRLCVVDGGKLVGVLSRRDLILGYLRPDRDIHREVVSEVFGAALGVPRTSVGVAVEHGVVLLLGQLDRKSDVELAVSLTGRIPGVVEVRNRLGYRWNDGQVPKARAVRA